MSSSPHTSEYLQPKQDPTGVPDYNNMYSDMHTMQGLSSVEYGVRKNDRSSKPIDLMDYRVMKKGPNDNFTKDTKQNVHNTQLTPFTRIFSYTSEHPSRTNQPYTALRNPHTVKMADFGGLVRTTIIIQVQNMAFKRDSFESDLADVLEALFSLPSTDSYTGESTGTPAIIQVMRVSLPNEDKSLMDKLVGKWTIEVLSQEQGFVRVRVRPPLGLGRRAKAFFTKGCGIDRQQLEDKYTKDPRTEYFANCKGPLIVMDHHQFYISKPRCYADVRQYIENLRKAAEEGFLVDCLPTSPLKIKMESCVDGHDFLHDFLQRFPQQ